MTLLVIVLALAMQSQLGPLQRQRIFSVFEAAMRRFPERFRAWPWNGPLGVAVVLILPAFGVALLHFATLYAFAPLAAAYDTLVLFYCLAPGTLKDHLETFSKAAMAGDEAGAMEAAEIVGSPGSAPRPSVIEGIAAAAHRRTLAVLLWYALLAPLAGPAAAFLYRLSERARHALGSDGEGFGFAGAAARLHALLDWLPVRCVSVLFALAGNYESAVNRLHGQRGLWFTVSPRANAILLEEAAAGALDQSVTDLDVEPALEQRIAAATGLIRRTVYLLVILVALVTLGHWIS